MGSRFGVPEVQAEYESAASVAANGRSTGHLIYTGDALTPTDDSKHLTKMLAKKYKGAASPGVFGHPPSVSQNCRGGECEIEIFDGIVSGCRQIRESCKARQRAAQSRFDTKELPAEGCRIRI